MFSQFFPIITFIDMLGEATMNNAKFRLQTGSIIKKRRETLNMTQADLAEAIDVTTGFIGQVERGESSPNLVTLKRIIDVLAIEPNILFGRKTENDRVESELKQILKTLSAHDKQLLLSIAHTLKDLKIKKHR